MSFPTNSNFVIPRSLQPDVVDLSYFKLWLLLAQIVQAWNIKVQRYMDKKIWVFGKISIPLKQKCYRNGNKN